MPVGFYGGADGLASCLLFGVGFYFLFFIGCPKSLRSLEYLENEERLIAATASNAYNIVSPV